MGARTSRQLMPINREAAEKLSSDREPEGPMRDGQSIE